MHELPRARILTRRGEATPSRNRTTHRPRATANQLVPFAVAVGGGDVAVAVVVAAGGMPADRNSGSDSDKELPLHEPQFVFHAVDDERRRRPAIHRHRQRPAADEERLRIYMLMPQAILCGSIWILGGLTIYLANDPEARPQRGFNWDVFVTASSALAMVFSLVTLLLSHLGVYSSYHG